MNRNLPIPKRMELFFDGAYLICAALMGVFLVLFRENTPRLWGVMALTLAAGDAFHLVPRMAAASAGNPSRYASSMGIGKLITSLTMTVFYILLWHCGLQLFSLTLPAQTLALYLLAGMRILLCLLPQNQWRSGKPGKAIGIYRNVPFLLQGILVMWLYASYGVQGTSIHFLWLAVLISFLCYLPVVLWSSKYPKLGMFMLPKTCAYLWIIAMGFGL